MKKVEEQPTTQSSKSNAMLYGILGIIVFAVIAYFGYTMTTNKQQQTTAVHVQPTQQQTVSSSPTMSESESPSASVSNAMMYKDGSYKATGNYTSPGGDESVNVTLVLKNDKVVDATVVGVPAGPNSKQWQAMFVDNYKQSVIGKDIATLQLSKVSGSSLTPKGFNEAVEKIKTEAKS